MNIPLTKEKKKKNPPRCKHTFPKETQKFCSAELQYKRLSACSKNLQYK